jgi:hypothetical protein
MTPATWFALAALATAGSAALLLGAENRELARRLDALEAAPSVAARPVADGDAPALSGEGSLATRRELDDLSARVTELARRPVPAASPAGASGAPLERRVEEALAKQLEGDEFQRRIDEAAQKAAEKSGKPAIEKKPTFAALSTYLSLDSAQEGDFRRDLEDVQGSLMALLAERRPDGRVLLEEIGAVDALPESDPKRVEVFLDLFQLKIPGTDETYVARAITLALDFRKRTSAYLRADQSARFASADIDLFGVRLN